MKHTRMSRLLRRSALVLALLGLLAGTASAQNINLVADEFEFGASGISMWGFADDIGQACGAGGAWAPGPTIRALASDALTINVRNCLYEPVSVVIAGQALKGAPEFDAGRVTSFTTSAPAFDGVTAGTASYAWAPGELKAGTYLYNSGTHPARQVHMGLYGAVAIDEGANQAYPGIYYDQDIVVVYSEIDPALHLDTDVVAPGVQPSTAQALNFKPKLFLVNGNETGNTDLTAGANPPLNSTVLLRFVNAGLKAYVPTLLGEDMDWVAEDGNPYPFAKRSYSAFLGAGKTMDAIWVPVTEDRHTLYDRRLHMSGNGYPGGGLRAFLQSGYANLPLADAGGDSFHVALGTPITLDGSASAGSGSYTAWDWSLVAFPAGSTATLVPDAVDPSIVTITPDVPGTYSAQLVVTDSDGAFSAPAVANVFTNLPPVAVAAVTNTNPINVGDTVDLDGSDSYDPDTADYGDTITSYDWVVEAPNLSTFPLSGPTPSFIADQVGTYTVELTVSDGELIGSDVVHVTSSVAVNQPPNAVDDFANSILRNSIGNLIYVLANDSDTDGAIVHSTLSIVTYPRNGSTAVVATDGTNSWVEYSPKRGWTGTDYFTYEICDDGGLCSIAQVLVNVVK